MSALRASSPRPREPAGERVVRDQHRPAPHRPIGGTPTMTRIDRRAFLGATGAGLLAGPLAGAGPEARRKKLAIVATEWRMQSHGQHMGDRFLVGYPLRGAWHKPGLDVAALYVDQKPRGDLNRRRAEEFGCKL